MMTMTTHGGRIAGGGGSVLVRSSGSRSIAERTNLLHAILL